eukprot:m.233602 g.233602  ORF g.233602 m.233602 type:complete len:95 (+) comp17385_c2_seq27:1264-1548(+)
MVHNGCNSGIPTGSAGSHCHTDISCPMLAPFLPRHGPQWQRCTKAVQLRSSGCMRCILSLEACTRCLGPVTTMSVFLKLKVSEFGCLSDASRLV